MSTSVARKEAKRAAWHDVNIGADLFEVIVGRLANGDSLIKVCREGKDEFGVSFPSPAGFLRWIQDNPSREKEYAGAMQIRADVNAEIILDVSEMDNTRKARNMMEAFRWHNEKMAPKKYGAKVLTENYSQVDVRHKVDFGSLSQAAREQLREVLTKQISAPTIEHEE